MILFWQEEAASREKVAATWKRKIDIALAAPDDESRALAYHAQKTSAAASRKAIQLRQWIAVVTDLYSRLTPDQLFQFQCVPKEIQ